MQALSKENVHRKSGEDRFEKLLEKWAESGMLWDRLWVLLYSSKSTVDHNQTRNMVSMWENSSLPSRDVYNLV